MNSIKGHFDGKTIMLDEPASLAIGQAVRVIVDADTATTQRPQNSRFGFATGMFEMRDDFDEPLDEFLEYR